MDIFTLNYQPANINNRTHKCVPCVLLYIQHTKKYARTVHMLHSTIFYTCYAINHNISNNTFAIGNYFHNYPFFVIAYFFSSTKVVTIETVMRD